VDRYIVKEVGMNYGGDMLAVVDTSHSNNIVCRVEMLDSEYADRICRLLNADAKEGSDG
jgi:hypothetical protein